jgi:hypothetical protein
LSLTTVASQAAERLRVKPETVPWSSGRGGEPDRLGHPKKMGRP